MDDSFFTFLRQQSPAYNSHIHGISHWQRVESYGLYLAKFSQADTAVISYFAYLHDAMRKNDNKDPEHGPRAAEFILNNTAIIELNKQQIKTLVFACKHHTTGRITDNASIATCWDADRLDMTRIGIEPKEKYLLTDEAKRIANTKDFNLLRSLF